MTVDLDVAGRRYRATVAARAGGTGGVAGLTVLLVPIDPPGEPIERGLDVRPTGDGYSIRQLGCGRVIDAAVSSTSARGDWLVQWPGVDLEVVVNGRRSGGEAASGTGGAEQRVCAPMPGRVLRVFVGPGDTVAAGQPLVVIEAMKMENALTALRDGVVHEVMVAEGVSVEAGRLLVRLG